MAQGMRPMTDLLVQYHVEDRLPAGAVALIETSGDHVDIYASAAYPREVVAAHLGPLSTAYFEAYDLHPDAGACGSG